VHIKTFIIGILLLGMFSLAGCDGSDQVSGGIMSSKDMLQSEKTRVLNPQIGTDDIKTLAADNTAFALDLYHQVRRQEDNLFYSPYSISAALAMTYAGAAGQTSSEMADTMHFSLDQARLHPAMNALDLALVGTTGTENKKDDSKFQLNLVNALWGQEGYTFRPEFLDILAEHYGAGLRTGDFAANPEKSRKTINDWVSDETKKKIQDLVPEGVINSLTRLVLVNAIYFDGSWMLPFKESDTVEEDFFPLEGIPEKTEMMHQKESFLYAAGDNYQAVTLPYQDTSLSMLILLPAKGEFKQFEEAFTPELLSEIIGNMRVNRVDLRLPKFHLEHQLLLAKTLAKMGMPQAFSMEADFSAMDGTKDLYLQDVIHKAFVDVDEAGTEAAAATAAIVGLKSLPPQRDAVEMRVDRPFIFMIRDSTNGTILFMGRVASLNQ